MIVGIGHDLTDVVRVSEMLGGKYGERLMKRVLTDGERKLAESYKGARLEQFVAGRFAAKEAISKAFGCGIGGLLGFGDIDIQRDVYGKPTVSLTDEAWSRLSLRAFDTAIHLTITHERALASAFAVIERIKL
ncbi:holo-ACP synthase [Paenibacillus soyae]|uniref:Holo-[acyl-carrier-protein] synthase n=1 Tax=Paenibacillus soyae TaxID=2969249 RepID=A0A9X2MTR5_9BACL|nr:holo-ACP synthase [Paenibacillus soyae]